MHIIYLSSALEDMKWVRLYYSSIFPAGGAKAREKILSAEQLIQDHPGIGRPSDDPDVRIFPITRTPFSFEYRYESDGDYIEIIRIKDNRSSPENNNPY